MNFIKEENRIYLKDKQNKIIAEIKYEKLENNIYNIYHTFVDKSLRGQGVASKLVQEAIKEIKGKGGNVRATCSYAKAMLEKHNLK